MSRNWAITLPAECRPIFPDRCIACGRADTLGLRRSASDTIGYRGKTFWLPGPAKPVEIPVCEECRSAVRRQRRIGLSLAVTGICLGLLVAIAFAVAIPAFGRMKIWLITGIGGAFLAPYFFWETFSSGPFGMQINTSTGTVDYEFQNAKYAGDFEKLNCV